MNKELKDYTDRELIKMYVDAKTQLTQLNQVMPVLEKELIRRAEEENG